MNLRRAAILLSFLLILAAVADRSFGEPADNITVNNADEVREDPVSVSQDLVDSTGSVVPRVILEFANQVRHTDLTMVPTPLQSLLEQVADRVIVQYGNTVRQDPLAAVPGTFQTLLEGTSARTIIQYANSNRTVALDYPLELVDDTSPPTVSNLATTSISDNAVVISWTTDEFADSSVQYGTQPGNYTETVSDPLYVKEHEVTLTGLSSGATYYYKIRSVDQSGNAYEGSEKAFTVQLRVYLPAIHQQTIVAR